MMLASGFSRDLWEENKEQSTMALYDKYGIELPLVKHILNQEGV